MVRNFDASFAPGETGETFDTGFLDTFLVALPPLTSSFQERERENLGLYQYSSPFRDRSPMNNSAQTPNVAFSTSNFVPTLIKHAARCQIGAWMKCERAVQVAYTGI
ncbi:hypothetical protein K504DRAFT_499104 [Pleomassaria siparia CBS 279.74]|uniref:Uncharacterized protein n=1 Tax=Pleomassaria siparia CBS 279.74 TaxID=1314801 RepID=A0A6G1KHZ7_9PLEO|nr:hypothetical protein K504DRAFT_499104 [Pleomassaria siparia CBS 279.74]